MKTFFVCLIVLSAMYLISRPTPRHEAENKRTEAQREPNKFASARKFTVRLEQVNPGGGALATGYFIDVPATNTTHPEMLKSGHGDTVQTGDIYIEGLSGNLVNGQAIAVWVMPNGTKTFATALGTSRTVPLYRAISDPPPVAPPVAALPTPVPWIDRAQGTALDKRPRESPLPQPPGTPAPWIHRSGNTALDEPASQVRYTR